MRTSLLAILLISLGTIQAIAGEGSMSYKISTTCSCQYATEDGALLQVAASFGVVATTENCSLAYDKLYKACRESTIDAYDACYDGVSKACSEASDQKLLVCSKASVLKGATACAKDRKESITQAQIQCAVKSQDAHAVATNCNSIVSKTK